MVHTQEEIINALQVIKDECDEIYSHLMYTCKDCPFSGVSGNCIFEEKMPIGWNIKPRNITWKALEE